MQVRKFLVTPTDVRIQRGLRHFAAMLLALAVIGHIFVTHGQLQLTSGSWIAVVNAMPVGRSAPIALG